MNKYFVPVTYTISGWVEISAENKHDALVKAEHLSDSGFVQSLIQDPDFSTEVFTDELSEITTPTEEDLERDTEQDFEDDSLDDDSDDPFNPYTGMK